MIMSQNFVENMMIKWVLIYITLIGVEPAVVPVEIYSTEQECMADLATSGKKVQSMKADYSILLVCLPGKIEDEKRA